MKRRRPRSGALRKSELGALRETVTRRARSAPLARWNADPQDAQRSVAKLVLALVEFLRKLMERQAIRRMDNATLSTEQIEAVGLALMRLEQTVGELAERFGLDPADLDVDLGPLGRLG